MVAYIITISTSQEFYECYLISSTAGAPEVMTSGPHFPSGEPEPQKGCITCLRRTDLGFKPMLACAPSLSLEPMK